MIDIHSHVIPGIDDGSRNLVDTIKMLSKMSELGFTDIICTPHFIENTEYCADCEQRKKILDIIETAEERYNIHVKLHMGNEIFISENIIKNIKDKKVSEIAPKTLLIEVPLEAKLTNLSDIIFDLQLKGYKLILAHPERYSFVQKDPKIIADLHFKGIKMQANYGSITGEYGRTAKRIVKKLLKDGFIDYFGSDIHRPNSMFYENFPKMIKQIRRITGKKYFDQIQENAKELIKEA